MNQLLHSSQDSAGDSLYPEGMPMSTVFPLMNRVLSNREPSTDSITCCLSTVYWPQHSSHPGWFEKLVGCHPHAFSVHSLHVTQAHVQEVGTDPSLIHARSPNSHSHPSTAAAGAAGTAGPALQPPLPYFHHHDRSALTQASSPLCVRWLLKQVS